MYKLDLSDSMRIARICHIFVLELVDPEVPLVKNILDITLKAKKRVRRLKRY